MDVQDIFVMMIYWTQTVNTETIWYFVCFVSWYRTCDSLVFLPHMCFFPFEYATLSLDSRVGEGKGFVEEIVQTYYQKKVYLAQEKQTRNKTP